MTDPTPTQRMAKGYGAPQAQSDRPWYLAKPGDTLGTTTDRAIADLAELHQDGDPNTAAIQRAKEAGTDVPPSIRMAAGYAANYAEAARRAADNA